MQALKRRLLKISFYAPHERCAVRLKPFLLIFKSCGIFANEIADGRLKRSSRRFYGIAVFWVSVYVSYMCFLLSVLALTSIVDLAKHFVGYASLSFNVVTAYISQDSFGKFFNRLDSYDREVARMKHKRTDNLWIPFIAALATLAVVLWLASVMVQDTSTGNTFLATISDICTLIMHMFDTLEKFMLLYLMLVRFKHLNGKIAAWASLDETERGSETIGIDDVKTMHLTLYEAHQIFGDIYRKQLLLSFASFMIHILVNIRAFRTRSLLISCIFVCTPIVQLLILCMTCHYTAEEANKIVYVLIEKMTALVSSIDTTTKIGILMYFTYNRVSFDAAGFFTINLPMFQSIIAAITTYFIVLV